MRGNSHDPFPSLSSREVNKQVFISRSYPKSLTVHLMKVRNFSFLWKTSRKKKPLRMDSEAFEYEALGCQVRSAFFHFDRLFSCTSTLSTVKTHNYSHKHFLFSTIRITFEWNVKYSVVLRRQQSSWICFFSDWESTEFQIVAFGHE